METDWLDICRAGTWTASNGEDVTLTTDDLDNIVGSYNPKEREAPLVLGHPKDNDPAYGWVSRLRRAGEVLQACFSQVSDDVKKLVSAGSYKKVSIALFPDKKTLRHVGLLGAAQPAVSGLKSVKFQGDDEYVEINFSADGNNRDQKTRGGNIMDEKIKELEKQLAESRKAQELAAGELAQAKKDKEKADAQLSAFKGEQEKKEVEARINSLIEKNNILPADKPAVSAIAMSLGRDDAEIELTAGAGKKRVVDHFFEFMAGLPDRKMLGEFAAPNGKEGEPADTGDLAKHV